MARIIRTRTLPIARQSPPGGGSMILLCRVGLLPCGCSSPDSDAHSRAHRPVPVPSRPVRAGAVAVAHASRHDAATVYLTFDDGPNPAATPDLLDVLREAGAPATFFVIDGHLTADTAPIVRRMFDEGHAVALHSDTRALMIKTPSALAVTLTRQRERIQQLTGGEPCRLFRPHGGWRSALMLEGLRRIEHRLVGWSFGLWDFNWYRRPEPRLWRRDWLAARQPETSWSCMTAITWTRDADRRQPWRRRDTWFPPCAHVDSPWVDCVSQQ